jgi:hypothetical protein
MEFVIACLIVITIMALYAPIVLIRTNNKILKALEKIEANTRK